jgi:periplasmic copper chaperone A
LTGAGTRFAVGTALCFWFACAPAADGITVHDAWIRESPPVIKMNAGYMRIRNDSDRVIYLNGATSPAFSHIEIHRTVHNGDRVHMHAEQDLPIPPHGDVTLEPGGLHLMLIRPAAPVLSNGEPIPITLLFSNGQSVDVMAEVRAPGN